MKRELSAFNGKKLSNNIDENIDLFSTIFEKDAAMRKREIIIGNASKNRAVLYFVDSMINADTLTDAVIRPLVTANLDNDFDNLVDYAEKKVLFADEISKSEDLQKIISSLLYGDTVIIFDGYRDALIINTKGWRSRGVDEPKDERVLEGPREGFDEALMRNHTQLRRKLPTPDLCIEFIKLGRKTDTKIFVCYIESLVNRRILNIIKERLKKIDIDGVLDSNYISELISKDKFSLFKTMGKTQKPDVVAAKLLEGRVAIMVDGTPTVLTAPYFFLENFQSDDDYYQNYLSAAIGRALRYICFYTAICLPAIFLAFAVYNPHLLPVDFLLSIISSRANVPFSTFGECVILIILFEILKETGIRMQQSVGHAMSIVGGLVVGQAAVEAGIISAPILIVTALSGICGLIVPKLKASVFYFKFLFVILSGFLGLFGFFIGLIFLHIHLYSLDSFAIPYVSAGLEFSKASLKDTLFRVNWKSMIKRPTYISKNVVRQKTEK